MDQRIELKLVGITYNQIESGVYALILEDVAATRRLAIVIGYPEAQSIECFLQRVRTPRPLSHDLMVNIFKTLGAKLLYVDIHRLKTGPYAGRLIVENADGERREIDARSSDAIAVAIRMGAPIYTSPELLESKGYSVKANNSSKNRPGTAVIRKASNEMASYSDEKLLDMLEKSVQEENYERAAEIKSEIERRASENDK